MCGIAGGYNIPESIVQQMNERQSNRGPDNTGIRAVDPSGVGGGRVIFGHTRLSIIDKSDASNQPIKTTDQEGYVWQNLLTYNGEIYNYSTYYSSDSLWLSKQLDNFTHGIEYESFDEILNSINGMFAFAYFDGEQIYLVRDRFGIKPLYYTYQQPTTNNQQPLFAFASTPAALTLTKSSWQVSQKGLQEYLSLGATMLHSMFDGIVAVPPGHYVTFNIKTHEIKTTRWYYPKYIENAQEVIQEKVIQAIDRVKLTCDWPQIILLSGGIDSTVISARYMENAAAHLASPEREYAQRVAEKFKLKFYDVDPTLVSMHSGLADYSYRSGEPTMAGYIPWITCREIAKQGYRVAITANGADELFFGYDRMRGLQQWSHIFREFEFTPKVFGDCFNRLNIRDEHNVNQWFNYPQWFEICTYLMFDLNKTLDFASMCHSVEVRVPYLDHELVEAALSIPMEDHTKRGNKTILKKMLWDMGFTREFTDRPKVGFSLHQSPPDQHELTALAMAWYRISGLPQLPPTATGRQESYHQNTVVGLYVWNKIYNLI